MTSSRANSLAVPIVAAALVMAVTSFWHDSVIVDEVPHIGAGYSYLVKHDMRLNPEHPPLAKILGALPMIFMDLNQDVFTTKNWQTDVNGQWEFGRKLIYNSGNDAVLITRAVKFPVLLFFVLAAVIIFIWTGRVYGQLGAFIALTLFCFSPTVLAHSRFVTTDVPAAFGILLATFFFTRWLKDQTRTRLLAASAAFGIALLTKFSTFLLIPFLGLLAVVWGFMHAGSAGDRFKHAFSHGLKSVLIFAVGFIIVVWPVYGVLNYNYPAERQKTDTTYLMQSFGKRYLAEIPIWMSDKPFIRPAGQYFLGLMMVVQRSAGGNTIYFLGDVVAKGGVKYFPIVYFLKEPLAWWGLVLIALLAVGTRVSGFRHQVSGFGHWVKQHFEEFAMVLWLVIYWATSLQSILNIGVRHLMPVYPFAIMLVSGQAAYLSGYLRKLGSKKFKLLSVLIAALMGWYAFESLRVHPSYLSYFNQAALLRPPWATDGQAGLVRGGHNFVVDSNLDWGQDLKRLADWVEQNGVRQIEVDYFGWADPLYYLGERFIWMSSTKYISKADFIARNRSNGWLAVSATFLQGSKGPPDQRQDINYDNWLKAQTPVTVIGNSIFVYHIEN